MIKADYATEHIEHQEIKYSDSLEISSSHSHENQKPYILSELPSSFDFVSPEINTKQVVDLFESNPNLPGILIIDSGKFLGMVSRKRCFEFLGHPFGVEIFYSRSIKKMLAQIDRPNLTLPGEMKIDQAVQVALSRPAEDRYESIVVDCGPADKRILDLHVLLQAQSQLLVTANQIIQRQVEIGRALSGTLEIEPLIHLILSKMGEIILFDRADVILKSRVGSLEYVAGIGLPHGFSPDKISSVLSDYPLFRRVIEAGEILVIDHFHNQDLYPPLENFSLDGAWLGLPLLNNGEVSGLLSVARKTLTPFTPQDLSLAQGFSDQAAIALQNANLYTEMRKLNKELELKVGQRTVELQEAYTQLQNLDRLKSDYIEAASREIFTPLNNISINAQSLITNLNRQISEENRKLLRNIIDGVSLMYHVTTSVQDMTRMDHKGMQQDSQPVKISDLISGLHDHFSVLAKEKNQRIHVDFLNHLPTIYGDLEGLRKVFFQLFLDAIRFAPSGGKIQISGVFLPPQDNPLKENANRITIGYLASSGVQESQGFLIQTESITFANEDSEEFKALGLAMVQAIVKAHRGMVWVENFEKTSRKTEEKSFNVLLPLHN
jgi:signal transduction histidine kinase